MFHGSIDNSGRLMRLIFRRERIMTAAWILILVAFSMGLAPAIQTMFPDADARNQFASTFDNPIMVAMMGPVYGIGNYTVGAMYGGMMFIWYLITVAVMNIFFIVRHTRADEENGRAEVVRSLPTGRLANINAAMLSALLINIAVGLFTGLGVAIMGVEGIEPGGSMLYGAATASTGLVFAAIAALFAQLSSSSSGATGYSLASVGVFYVIRAAGDARGSEIISCISPLGLAQRSQVFVENRIWPTLTLLIAAILISFTAYWLNSVRDLGQGFITAKPGRATARPGLLSPLGLAWRLLRNTLIAWAVTMFILGASYSSIIADISSFIGGSPEYMTIIGVPVGMLDILPIADQEKLIVDSFGVFVTLMMSLMCVVPLLSSVLKLRSEEREGRAEHIISRATPRIKYMAGYVLLAYAASVVMQLLTATGLYCAAAAMTGDSNPFTLCGLLKSYFAFLPALWVMVGFAVLVVGLLPKAAGILWGYFGVVAFTSFVGRLVLPEWVMNLSPFHFVSQPEPLKAYVPEVAPLVVLTVVAAALTTGGFFFYSKRDVAA